MNYLQEKLKRDLYKLCINHTNGSNIDVIQKLIDEKVNDKLITSTSYSNSLDRIRSYNCIARVWCDRRGKQCNVRKTCGDFCKQHQKMIDEHGVLRFGTVHEAKPTYDLIKLTCNQRKETLKWYNKDRPMETLDMVVRHHNHKLEDNLLSIINR